MALLSRDFLRGLARRLTPGRPEAAHHDEAREFWESGATEDDENHYWAAQPLVRRAINRRVTGNPDVWPMEWFAARYAPRPFGHGLSAGCGDGGLERDLLRKNICRTVEGVDFSQEALRLAQALAEEEGLADRVRYRNANLDTLALPAQSYDIVFFHGSLHHVREVEKILATVERSLKPGGMVYLDEYMGPSRDEWSDSLWRFARAAFDELPTELKNRPNLMIPLPLDDPSESIRSSTIRKAVVDRFELVEEKPYGGNLLWFTLPCIDIKALRRDPTGALSRMVALEDHLLEQGWVESYFRILIARKRQ
jgi:SAM-dependent methyltransferase